MTMKFTDPVTKQTELIDGVLKPADGTEADDGGWNVPRVWSYVDKEGVKWTIRGHAEGVSPTLNYWSASMDAFTSTVYYRDARGVDPIMDVAANTLLGVVNKVDAYGVMWRSAQRRADKATAEEGNRKWGWLLLLGLAWLANKKGKR